MHTPSLAAFMLRGAFLPPLVERVQAIPRRYEGSEAPDHSSGRDG
jgi:hypothetical protein